MSRTRNDKLLIGIILVSLTKILHWNSVFLVVGLIVVFDALFGNNAPEDTSNNDHYLDQ